MTLGGFITFVVSIALWPALLDSSHPHGLSDGLQNYYCENGLSGMVGKVMHIPAMKNCET